MLLQDHKIESVQKIANGLVKEAHRLAFDPDYMSPFALSAADNGFEFQGQSRVYMTQWSLVSTLKILLDNNSL